MLLHDRMYQSDNDFADMRVVSTTIWIFGDLYNVREIFHYFTRNASIRNEK